MSSSDATLSSPLFVPDALKFYVNRLSFSKNRVRLQALSSTMASANSQVIVRLPSNTMVNLASLTMTGAVRGTVSNPASLEGAVLPPNWDFSFIETLSLIANGGIITQPFLNYKLLGWILNDVHGSDDMDKKRNALQGSIPKPVIDQNIIANQNDNYFPFSINNWLSATQTMAPSYISTNLLGDLELRLTMADNSVVGTAQTSDGAAVEGLQTRASWDMKNINFYIETASVGSVTLEQAIAAKLSAGEPINVPFENVFSFQQSNGEGTYNQRFSVSSQSVNKIIATSQRQDILTPSQTTPEFGQRTLRNGMPNDFIRNSCGARFAQFSINNMYSPNYQVDSQLTTGLSLSNPIVTAPNNAINTNSYNMSNGLVETRAAMDIPDYDYHCPDKLTSFAQPPFEFFGQTPRYVAGTDPDPDLLEYIQPPAEIIADNNGNRQTYGAANTLSTYWIPYQYQDGIDAYLRYKYVLATSFDFDAMDKDRLVSGVNTLGSNAQMFLNVVGGGVTDTANVSTVYVLCTSMVQIYAGATLKIIQ